MENLKKTNSMDWETGKVKGFSGKSLIEVDNGGLKKVKVDPFSIYPTHLHPDKTEFIYVLEGTPKITVGEHIYNGEKDDFFSLPESVKHSIENPANSRCILLVGALKTDKKPATRPVSGNKTPVI